MSALLKLVGDLETSDVRLRAAEEEIRDTRKQLQGTMNQAIEQLEMLGWRFGGGRTLNSMGDPGPAPPTHDADAPFNVLNMTTTADGGVMAGTLQNGSLDPHLVMRMASGPVGPRSDLLNSAYGFRG